MRIFDPRARQVTSQQARRYAMFEVLHTIADFLAAMLFVIGSILFFSEQTKVAATFCFLIGSLFFAAKPSIRLVRELWLARLDKADELAGRAPEGPNSIEHLTDG
ncbi:YrhK family protein [Promicromonospora umidemergens]|uniref:YrhK family protein n=1 Tax=Promicromonospora umidemergens TaxID=629679 RepID=UPI0020A4B51D|nr:YrhK family protein [Promicromonospora umidemergens]